MAKQKNELELVQASISGDSSAFESIVSKYQTLVCAITYSGTGDVDKSEELAQETFVRAWKDLGQLREISKLKAWLCSIARTCVLNYRRREQRNVISKAASLDEVSTKSSDAPGPDELLIAKEQQAVVAQAIMQIPESYRVPLVLYYRQGQSTREVAKTLNMSEENVRTRLSRGRKMLKEQVAAMVESTISSSGPGKAFTAGVMVAVGSLALKSAGVAAATTGVKALFSTVAAKVVTAAAVVVIGIGAVVAINAMKDGDTSELSTSQVSVINQQESATDEDQVTAVVGNSLEGTSVVEQAEVVKVETPTPIEEVVAKTNSEEGESEAEKTTAYEFKAKGVLSGLVTDIETGEPVVGAKVNLEKGTYIRAETDENGFYSFEEIKDEGNYRIGIISKEYIGLTDRGSQPQVYLKKTDKIVKHLQLPKACMVDVYVVNEDGEPIKGTRLWVTSLAEERGREVGGRQYSKSTDKDGYCLLGGIPAAKTQYLITAVHSKSGKWIKEGGRKYREEIREYAPGHAKVVLDDPDIIKSCQVVLKKGAMVKGIAKYTDGTPAKECKIVPIPDWWHLLVVAPQYTIDPNGAFALANVVPGTYQVQVSVPFTNGGGSRGITLMTTKLPLKEGKLLEIVVPEKPADDSPSGRIVKDSDPKPKVKGVVVDAATAELISVYRTRFTMVGTSYYPALERWEPSSNANGKFEIDIAGGKHVLGKVQVAAKGYAPKWSEVVNTADESVVTISLSKGGVIRGRVVDEKGKPVDKAKVLAFSVAGSSRKPWPKQFTSEEGVVVTNARGEFALKDVAAGEEYLKVIHPGYTHLISTAITVGAGEVKNVGKLVLNKGGVVEGYFYDEQGKGVPNVTLYAKNHYMYSDSKVTHATVTTDPNGFYRMENLPEEMCYITQGNMNQKSGVVSRAVVPSNGKVVRVDMGNGPMVKGRLVVGGKVLSNTSVNLSTGNLNISGLHRCRTNTDENGNFVLRAGRAGKYMVSYQKRDGRFTHDYELAVVEVGIADVDLGVLPAKGKTLNVKINIKGGGEGKEIGRFSLRKDYPIYGGLVYYAVDRQELKDKAFRINDLQVGRYYAVVYYDSRTCHWPIDITDESDEFDVVWPIAIGNVTLSGSLPSEVNHLIMTDKDFSFFDYIMSDESGEYSISGLLPGEYFFALKKMDFNDSIPVTVGQELFSSYDFELEQLYEKLRDDLFVFVADEKGYSVAEAEIWVECDGKIYKPAWHDGYSGRFYLPSGECTIHAKKDGMKVEKAFRFYIDKNRTAAMESRETFVQF